MLSVSSSSTHKSRSVTIAATIQRRLAWPNAQFGSRHTGFFCSVRRKERRRSFQFHIGSGASGLFPGFMSFLALCVSILVYVVELCELQKTSLPLDRALGWRSFGLAPWSETFSSLCLECALRRISVFGTDECYFPSTTKCFTTVSSMTAASTTTPPRELRLLPHLTQQHRLRTYPSQRHYAQQLHLPQRVGRN